MTCRITVITVSDRSFSGSREDISGPLAAHLLGEFGTVSGPIVVPDGIESVQNAIVQAIREGATVVFTTGGTGVTPRDLTPEATKPLVIKRLPGVEALLRDSTKVPTAALSRGVAGIAREGENTAFVVNAPGSTGGVRDAVAHIGPLLAHITEQMRGEESLHSAAGQSAAHAQATWRIQHRSEGQKSDAQVVRAGVTKDQISMDVLVADVADPRAGAVVTFCGQVRNHDDSRGVRAIEYEAHPDAARVVGSIANDVAAGSGACRISVLHRTGSLAVGDVALGAAVSAAHRAEAFALIEKLVEQIKLRLPVWKKQEFTDGRSEWTGYA
jgi:molybdenum cofactor synthesis domain-containing protein